MRNQREQENLAEGSAFDTHASLDTLGGSYYCIRRRTHVSESKFPAIRNIRRYHSQNMARFILRWDNWRDLLVVWSDIFAADINGEEKRCLHLQARVLS